MKKIILGLFIVINSLILATGKSISEIKNLSFEVTEISFVNGEKREQRYEIVLELPGKMKKTVLAPQMNRGEIYLYADEEKTVFLPFFNQIQKSKISQEENRILEFINTVISKEKNDKNFKENYYLKENQYLTLNSGEKIFIDRKEEFEGFLLPKKVRIHSGEVTVADLELKNIKVNNKLEKTVFEI